MVINEGFDSHIGEVIWVWADDIRRSSDGKDNRWFNADRGRIRVTDLEVPVSVHDKEGRTIGLMIPRVLAHLNGIYAS